MIWQISHRADPFSADIADRHYSRQTVGSPQFVPPGSCFVLKAMTPAGRAYWVTSWPFAEYTKHAWAGAWICSAFRNEGAGVASEMIRQAVAATRAHYGEPPALGMITFVDRKKVRPYVTAGGKEIFGQVFRQAGFREDGETKGGLLTLKLAPERMPPAAPACGQQVDMFAANDNRYRRDDTIPMTSAA